MSLTSYIKKNFLSLKGHLVIFGVPFFFFFVALGLGLTFQEGTLTLSWAAFIIAVSAVFAPLQAIIVYCVVTKSFILPNIK